MATCSRSARSAKSAGYLARLLSVSAEQRVDCGGLHWPAEVEALGEAGAEGGEADHLTVTLDALGNDLQIQRARQTDDGAHQCALTLLIAVDVVDERAIDL